MISIILVLASCSVSDSEVTGFNTTTMPEVSGMDSIVPLESTIPAANTYEDGFIVSRYHISSRVVTPESNRERLSFEQQGSPLPDEDHRQSSTDRVLTLEQAVDSDARVMADVWGIGHHEVVERFQFRQAVRDLLRELNSHGDLGNGYIGSRVAWTQDPYVRLLFRYDVPAGVKDRVWASSLPVEFVENLTYSRSDLELVQNVVQSMIIESGYKNAVVGHSFDPLEVRLLVSSLSSDHEAETRRLSVAIIESVQTELGHDISDILSIDMRDGPVFTPAASTS